MHPRGRAARDLPMILLQAHDGPHGASGPRIWRGIAYQMGGGIGFDCSAGGLIASLRMKRRRLAP